MVIFSNHDVLIRISEGYAGVPHVWVETAEEFSIFENGEVSPINAEEIRQLSRARELGIECEVPEPIWPEEIVDHGLLAVWSEDAAARRHFNQWTNQWVYPPITGELLTKSVEIFVDRKIMKIAIGGSSKRLWGKEDDPIREKLRGHPWLLEFCDRMAALSDEIAGRLRKQKEEAKLAEERASLQAYVDSRKG